MSRLLAGIVLFAALALAANVRLYLKDGDVQLVKEYKVDGDRVRFYSVERSDWEEVPLALVDLKRTEAEIKQNEEEHRETVKTEAAEEAAERAQRRELERVPVDPGVYLVEGDSIKTIAAAESKIVNNKRRSVLKVLSPVPIISGKAVVELDGEHSSNLTSNDRPDFYIRLSKDERFGIVRLTAKKGVRVVETLTTIPVSKEVIEEQQTVETFRRQLADGLYKIWPTKPIEPGEYAVIEYTEGKVNLQVWDFARAAK